MSSQAVAVDSGTTNPILRAWRNKEARGVIIQIGTMAAVFGFGAWLISNAIANLEALGKGFSYGFLFDNTTFISLDPAAGPGRIPLAGMRIGINGSEAQVGQAYRTLDTAITDSLYGPLGQPSSTIGTP